MIAYEQCHRSATYIITQYVVILDFLINTEKDVKILVDNKIIVNWSGDANKVVALVKNLSSHITMTSFNTHYYAICKSLNGFYENPYNKQLATLRHEFFYAPWRTVSFGIFILTAIQAVCSVISLFHGKKSCIYITILLWNEL